MRRASICVLLLTFLALVAGTLAVPARSAGLIWTVTPTVVTSVEAPGAVPVPEAAEGADAESPKEAEEAEEPAEALPSDGAGDREGPVSTSVFIQGQANVALALGQPDLHWQPLWKLFWPDPAAADAESQWLFTSTPANVKAGTLTLNGAEDWTVDTQAWALQLGLILAIGGLLFLALRIIAARREANRDLHALAAR